MHMQADARRLTHQVQIGVGEGGEQGDGLEDARAHLAGEHVAHGAQEGGEVVLLEGQDLDGPAHSDDVGVTGLVQQEGHLSEVVAGPELEQLHLPVVLGLRALDAALLDEVEGVAWFGWRWMVGVVCMVGGERRWAGNGSLGCVCTHVHTDTNNTHPSPPPPPHTHTHNACNARTHAPISPCRMMCSPSLYAVVASAPASLVTCSLLRSRSKGTLRRNSMRAMAWDAEAVARVRRKVRRSRDQSVQGAAAVMVAARLAL